MSHAETIAEPVHIMVLKNEIDRLRDELLIAEKEMGIYEAFYLATINKQGYPLRKRAEMLRVAKQAIESIR